MWSELEPIPVRVVVGMQDDQVPFRLVADDADAADVLTVQYFRVSDDGKSMTPFHTGTLTALDPPLADHLTWRSVRDDLMICRAFTPAKTLEIAVFVSDRGFNQQDGTVVSGGTYSRANWVFECP